MSDPDNQEIIIRPEVASPEDRAVMIAKAISVGSSSPISQSNRVQPEDVADRFREAGALVAPYDPATMTLLMEHSNSLRQNVDAYVTNIDAFGYHLEATFKLDSENILEDIRTAMVEEALLKNPEQVAIPRPSDQEVEIRIQQIKKQMQIEHSRLTFFFSFCCADQSFTSLRRKMRQDLEVTGNAYWEVMRNKKKEIAQLETLPSASLRILPMESRPIQVDQRVMTTAITYDTRKIFRRFRRFVQTFNGHSVYFKEFGDPRIVSSKTGRAYTEEAAMITTEGAGTMPANELLHFSIYSPGGPYGVPRWIGALLAVLGSRQSEEVNLMYFENKSVPPMVMMVSGGRVTEETVKRIEDFIKNDIKGKKNFHNILLLEAEGPLTQGGTEHTGRMKIELRPLTQAINSDALFQKYDEKNMQKVGQAFRLPALLRGDSRDFNRATALAVLQYTEKQVFSPERQEFDDKLNRTILSDCGICYWKFVSNSPKVTDPEEQAKVLERLVRAGTLIPEEARNMASEILNKDLRTIRQPWTQIPFPLAVAGRVDEIIMMGAVLDRIEEMMEDGVITPAESDEKDELIGTLEAEEGEDAPKKPKKPDEDEDTEKADMSTGDLSSGGLLVPGQGSKKKPKRFSKLPPKIESLTKDLAGAMSAHKSGSDEQQMVTLKVPMSEWKTWQAGFTPASETEPEDG